MTATLDRNTDPVADADAAVAEAESLIGQLEARVVDGDATVTAEDLEQARGLRRLALLRKQGAQRRSEEAAAARLEHDRDALREELAAFISDASRAQLQGAYVDAVQAIRALSDAATATETRHRDLVSRAETLGVNYSAEFHLTRDPMMRPTLALEWATTEAQSGRPPDKGNAYRPHPLLHTPEAFAGHSARLEREQRQAADWAAKRRAEYDERDADLASRPGAAPPPATADIRSVHG